MCGISGCLVSGRRNEPPELLARVVASQHRRGPDATDFEARPAGDGHTLWLAHNRLSIIDISSAADQPFLSADGRHALVFNGAIYNYVELRAELAAEGFAFLTSSDTEVLLAALIHWGAAALPRLYGMFAFAFHDREAGTLLMARDRFGVKPLYYAHIDGELWFASTPGVIGLAAGARPNLEYAGRGIRLKYYEDQSAIAPFERVWALPPGHLAIVALTDGGVAPAPYYDLGAAGQELVAELADLPADELQTRLRALLADATRIRLRADVPIGISLSGGVDSTTIAALCAREGTMLRGYSFGTLADGASEAPLVERFARSIGQQVNYIGQPTGADAQRLFWQTMRAQGAPFPHTSQMAQYAVFERARADGIKVMLGGQGGDEGFMGYRKFFLFQLRDVLRRKDIAAMPNMAGNALSVLPSILSRAGLFWRERGRYFAHSSEGLGSGLSLPPLENSPSPGAGLGGSPRDRQVFDIVRYSLPSLLRYEDRNSMGNSIESRLPFLDHRVLEFGVALPTVAKLRGGMGKHVLRQAMRGLVPGEVLFNRDKRGFDTRHGDFIAGGVGSAIRDGMRAHGDGAKRWIGGADPERFFADAELTGNASRFAEATTVLWMLDPSLESYPA